MKLSKGQAEELGLKRVALAAGSPEEKVEKKGFFGMFKKKAK